MEDTIRRTISRRNVMSQRKRSKPINHFRGLRKVWIQLMISMLILICILGIRNFNITVSDKINSILNTSVDFNNFYRKVNEFGAYIYKESEIFFNKQLKAQAEVKQADVDNSKKGIVKTDDAAVSKAAESTAAKSPGVTTTKSVENVPNTASQKQDKPNHEAIVLSSVNSWDSDVKTLKAEYLFIRPVKGGVTSPFGLRINPITQKEEFHPGLDMKAAQGTPIAAALGGKVIEARAGTTFGNFIKIQSGSDNVITVYAHCSKLLVKKGQVIKRGQKIALAGSTGMANGPHLHFEIWTGGKLVDPALVLGN